MGEMHVGEDGQSRLGSGCWHRQCTELPDSSTSFLGRRRGVLSSTAETATRLEAIPPSQHRAGEGIS